LIGGMKRMENRSWRERKPEWEG